MTIRERRGGWQVIVYAGLDPLTGRQRQVTRQVNGSRREAEKVEARLKTEVDDGRHAGTRAKTFGELLDKWLQWRTDNGKPISPRTVNGYRSLIEAKIKPALGGRRLGKIDPRALDAFYAELRRAGNAKAERHARARVRADAPAAAAAALGQATGQSQDSAEDQAAVTPALGPTLKPTLKPTAAEKRLSASRVHDVHVIISGALGLAARWGWVPFNVALVVRPAAGKGETRAVPTPEQVRELFTAVADDPELAAFLRLSATTGFRPGEVCALRWCDVDLDAGEVRVSGNIVTTKGLPEGYIRQPPKSDHGVRVLALDQGTVALLKAHRTQCETVARELELKLVADGYVFPRSLADGRPVRPDAMTRRFTELAIRLGHDYRLYGLRHFMASQLGAVAAAGTVRDRMGHGSLAVTSGYMHPVSEADR